MAASMTNCRQNTTKTKTKKMIEKYEWTKNMLSEFEKGNIEAIDVQEIIDTITKKQNDQNLDQILYDISQEIGLPNFDIGLFIAKLNSQISVLEYTKSNLAKDALRVFNDGGDDEDDEDDEELKMKEKIRVLENKSDEKKHEIDCREHALQEYIDNENEKICEIKVEKNSIEEELRKLYEKLNELKSLSRQSNVSFGAIKQGSSSLSSASKWKSGSADFGAVEQGSPSLSPTSKWRSADIGAIKQGSSSSTSKWRSAYQSNVSFGGVLSPTNEMLPGYCSSVRYETFSLTDNTLHSEDPMEKARKDARHPSSSREIARIEQDKKVQDEAIATGISNSQGDY